MVCVHHTHPSLPFPLLSATYQPNQAASPDEGALVTAAANFGYKLVSQSPQSMTVEIQPPSADHPTTEVYELLDVLGTAFDFFVCVWGGDGSGA